MAVGILAIAAVTGVLAQGDADLWRPESANAEAGRAVVVGAFAVRPTPETASVTPAQVACIQCHGIDGKGDQAAVFPRLTDQVYGYLYESLRHYASGARQNAVMTPIAKALNDQQMRDVSAFYAAQEQADYGERPASDPELLQLGGAIAAVGSAQRGVQGCLNCHGPDGVGLPPVYPYLAGQYANYLEAQLRAWKAGQRGGGQGSLIMEHIAKRLTDEEIKAVSVYYASLRPRSVTPENAASWRPGGR
jgi:cytochrome c553